jgi:positive regulator of sigma E activity
MKLFYMFLIAILIATILSFTEATSTFASILMLISGFIIVWFMVSFFISFIK